MYYVILKYRVIFYTSINAIVGSGLYFFSAFFLGTPHILSSGKTILLTKAENKTTTKQVSRTLLIQQNLQNCRAVLRLHMRLPGALNIRLYSCVLPEFLWQAFISFCTTRRCRFYRIQAGGSVCKSCHTARQQRRVLRRFDAFPLCSFAFI